jgi:hypothetical protein
MRRVGFEIGDDERTECYLSALPGDAGGLAANVDRWRQQMSLAPLGPEELAALPRAPILDRDAVEIDLRGTWKGMSGREDGESFRMIGWLAIDPQGSLFFRIVGPSAVVDREADAFRAVGRSFRRASGRAEVDAAATAIAATSPKLGRALAWQTPEGWQRAPDRPMREVGFSIGGNPRAEAYVTVLFGQAGGALANVNRWRQQMGRPALARAEIEDLPRIDVLGGEALVVEVDGSFTGMDGARVDEAYLLGAVCTLADCTVFVKLTGPRDVVAPERERFVAFCRSLTSAEK